MENKAASAPRLPTAKKTSLNKDEQQMLKRLQADPAFLKAAQECTIANPRSFSNQTGANRRIGECLADKGFKNKAGKNFDTSAIARIRAAIEHIEQQALDRID